MKEALNRTLKPGNIVLVKKGKYNEDFSIGIIIGKSGVTTDGEIVINSYGTCYLLENPTDYERCIGDQLLQKYIKHRRKVEKEAKAKKDKLGTTSLKDVKVGDIGFLPSTNEYLARKLWIYLGKVNIEENYPDGYKLITDMYAYAYYGVMNDSDVPERCLNALRQIHLNNGKLSDQLLRIRILKRPIPFIKDGIVDNIELSDKYRYTIHNKYGYIYLKK